MTKPARAKIPVSQLPVTSIAPEETGCIEVPKLALELRKLRDQPRGSGSPVRVLPVFGASDHSTGPLRQLLNLQGHRTKGWGFGSNISELPDTVGRLGQSTHKCAEQSPCPVSPIGWRLGGSVKRKVARDRPNAVRRVLTYGSPAMRGPKSTTVATLGRG